MADEKSKSKKPRIRKTETVRQKAEKAQASSAKPRRIRKTASHAAKPVKAAGRVLKKEYHPVKLPDNKTGRFMTKRRSFIPRYFRDSWAELKFVTWTTNKETWKLVFAVFIFALGFGLMIAIVDFGLDKVFKRLILG